MKSRHLMAATALTAAVAFSGMSEAGESSNAAYTVLYAFKGGTKDGSRPYSPVLDSAGTLYGTTSDGGAGKYGTIFKIAPDGSETVIRNFQGHPSDDPLAGLIEDAAGNFYGTTYNHLNGYGECKGASCGSVFKLGTNEKLTVLHSFPASTGDGRGPFAGVIMDQSGNLYGTTVAGGSNCPDSDYGGCGAVFKIAPDGTETVLYSFCADKDRCNDGFYPYAGVILDGTGNLYGTAEEGGLYGYGTVFKLAPDGTLTVLHSFTSTDGANPEGGLIMDGAGNLYGTAVEGGQNGYGTVFKLAPNGTLTLLHAFASTDGANPKGGLIMDDAGVLYGTTSKGGASGYGTVFKLKPDGKEIVLHSFAGGRDGAYPYAGLIADTAGHLFGTTANGGDAACSAGCGTVFRLKK